MSRRAAPARKPPPEDVVETFDFEQRSEEWFAARMGIPTASEFGAIMSQGEEARMRSRYLYRLAGEILSGQPAETYTNRAMERGIAMEPAAIANYEFLHPDAQVERIGFVKRTVRKIHGDIVVGCSPDALVGADGLLQVKTMQPDLLAEFIDRGRFPTEHRWQAHGEIWVTGRAWCTLKVFYDGFPVSPEFVIERNEAMIRQLSDEVERFSYDLVQVVKRIRERRGR